MESNIPDGLREELRRLAVPRLEIDAVTDARIRDRIHAHFESRRRAWWRRPLPRVAAAAALVLALLVLEPRLRNPRPDMAMGEAATPADVDGNGRVDILDAFALARHIEGREVFGDESIPLAWDQDGDGHLDRRDVVLVAQAAVSLGEDG